MVDVAVLILVFLVIRAIIRFFRFVNTGGKAEDAYNRMKSDHLSTFLFLVIGGGAGLIEATRIGVSDASADALSAITDYAIPMIFLWFGYLFCVIWWLQNFLRSVNPSLSVKGTVLDINTWPGFLQTVAVFVLIAAAIGAALFIVLAFSYYAANILSLIIPS